MTEGYPLESERFYRERDLRTFDYLGSNSLAKVPVSVHVSNDVCKKQSGQLLLLTLVNLLARIHRELYIALPEPDTKLLTPALCKGSNLGDEITKLTRRIDPYGKFVLDGPQLRPSKVSIGMGANCRPDLTWYLGYNRSIAKLAKTPAQCGLVQNNSSALRGAGLAALLGVAAVTKSALGIDTVPITVSAWNYKTGTEAEAGPADLPKIDVGNSLMIGAGAVASATIYWLMQWGNTSSWTVVDRDTIKLHNTNRNLLFFPGDAGWLDKTPKAKVYTLKQYLPEINPVCKWYDQASEANQQFDTVLVLANERDVRTVVSHRNDPIQLQATTGRSWNSQLHRHIAGLDDCVRCRMSDIRESQYACSEATLSTGKGQTDDAALPFLSAASGLMLVSALQRLQLSDFSTGQTNFWSWDFQSASRMFSSGYSKCKDDCSIALTRKIQ